MNDTVLLEWKALVNEINSAPAKLHLDVFKKLKEHEEYMIEQGFTIGLNVIIDPSGEVVWTRKEDKDPIFKKK